MVFFFSFSVQGQRTLTFPLSEFVSLKWLNKQEACYYCNTVTMLEMGNASLIILW